MRVVPRGVDEESHREEMSAAIRAQRERGAVPDSILHGSNPRRDDRPEPEPAAQPPQPGFLARLLRRQA